MAGVRVIVQAGWSDINAEQFLIIAKEAEKQAKLALLVDEDEDEDEDDSDLGKDIEERDILKSASKNDMRNDMNSRNSGGGNLSQKRGVKVSHWNAERDSLLIGSCPHSWLFDRVGAVVHHGGAGSDSVVVLCCVVDGCVWCVWDEKWCVVLCCLVLSFVVLSCLVLSCLVLSCLVLSCLVLSCLMSVLPHLTHPSSLSGLASHCIIISPIYFTV